jgi:hypothetical protein
MKIPDILDLTDVVFDTMPFNPCTILVTKRHVRASKSTHEDFNNNHLKY